eukprot:UN15387
MNCSTTNLVWKSKTGITPANVYNFDLNPPKTRKPCKHDDKFSKGRQGNFSSHKRQLTLQDVYNCGYTSPILTLSKRVNHRGNREKNDTEEPTCTEKRKINEEDSSEMELDDKF